MKSIHSVLALLMLATSLTFGLGLGCACGEGSTSNAVPLTEEESVFVGRWVRADGDTLIIKPDGTGKHANSLGDIFIDLEEETITLKIRKSRHIQGEPDQQVFKMFTEVRKFNGRTGINLNGDVYTLNDLGPLDKL